MKAEIITIGDEILIGQVIDTNSAYLASELNKLGVSVIQITSVSDNPQSIITALDNAAKHAELIITTGGLGPTSDDITKQTLAAYFHSKLTHRPEVLESIRSLLAYRGVDLNDLNMKQAELPDTCEVLHNSAGTAQGMWFKKDDRDYISLPGVPYEMKAIYHEEMEPRLKQRFDLPAIHHVTVLTHGMPESEMAGLIHNWEESLPANVKLAYLPSPGILRLRLTGKTTGNTVELKKIIESELADLKKIIGQYIFGYDNEKLEVIVGNLLKENNLTLSLAESCTGGSISGLITSVPGSSACYLGGIVAYSNEIKIRDLKVSPHDLSSYGAVSQQVVEQMAVGARNHFKTDFSVAVSGIAGPAGGTTDKPVGTTWIAVASKHGIISRLYHLGEDRGRNIQKASLSALFLLNTEIRKYL